MKKALKISVITLLTILCLLVVIPFAFQSQIKDMVKHFINENLNAKVEFADVNLSFIRSFPEARVKVNDLVITNFKPFEDETFATAKSIAFTMSIKELFKKAGDEPIIVNSIAIDEVLLTLKTNTFGDTNYDITKKNETSSDTEGNNFSFNIEDYKINNSALTYIDEVSKTHIYLTELNHIGKGTFSTEVSELDTKSETNVSFIMDSTKYLSNIKIKLDALIGVDLNKSIYTFKKNKGFINQLPLEFAGYLQQLDNGQEIDITFENPESSFKDFLAIVPETYSKNLDNIETSGNFKVKGKIKGLISDETIPKINVGITSNNGSFKYPDLPKRVENIIIDTHIINKTGNYDDTYIDIKTFNFKIDSDVFKSSAIVKNFTKNMFVNANVDGTLNLSNLTKAYPIELETPLSGILKAKLNSAFDMNAIETNAYERIKNSGTASITGFNYSSEELANPIQISDAKIIFTPNIIRLNNFEATTGESDLKATGTIKNILGFLMSKNNLQGNFDVNSNTFILNDFMVAERENTSTTKKEAFKIPAFLDCTINANAKNVVYDNLTLREVSGTLIINNQEATLKNLTSNLFDGIVAVTGNVSTKADIPSFNLNMGVDGFDISKSFNELDLFKTLAPIAGLFNGKLNSIINLKGTLNEEFTPNLNSISGDAFAALLNTSINDENSKLLNSLNSTFKFIDFNELDIKDLNLQLDFVDGNVTVMPFNVLYKDIDIAISGSHGFDKTIAYNTVLNVPAKYLGNEVNGFIGRINNTDVNNLSVPVTANITGTFNNPSVSTDLSESIKNLTNQLIEVEKEKAINTATDKIKDLLGGLTGGTENDTTEQYSTTTQTDSVKVAAPATKPDDRLQEGVKNILGGLINNQKTKNDTIK